MPVIYENVTVLEVDDPMIMLEVSRKKTFQRALIAPLDDRRALIDAKRIDALVKMLDKMGHRPRIG